MATLKSDMKEETRHLIFPHTRMRAIEEEGPRIIVEGTGIFVRDSNGKEYIDGTAGIGWCMVGHGRKELAQVAAQQMERLEHYLPLWRFGNYPAIELARKLAGLTPGALNRVLFTNSGSEAVDSAVKLARLYFHLKGQPNRVKIISLSYSFHGGTYGAMSATGLPKFSIGYDPGVGGFAHAVSPYCFRCELNETYPMCEIACAKALEETIVTEGEETVAAVIAEPVLGGAGFIIPPAEYLPMLAKICERHGILLIVDEVLTGFGRTGRMFGTEHSAIEPDLMTLAKGITSGYAPLGALMVNDRVSAVLQEDINPLFHGHSWSGHATAAAVAHRNIEIIEREGLVENGRRVGGHLINSLRERLGHRPEVGDIRGLGLGCAIELVRDAETKAPLENEMDEKLEQAIYRRGLISRTREGKIILYPPLILTIEQAEAIIGIVEEALNEVFS